MVVNKIEFSLAEKQTNKYKQVINKYLSHYWLRVLRNIKCSPKSSFLTLESDVTSDSKEPGLNFIKNLKF